jgi:hypothetical protein
MGCKLCKTKAVWKFTNKEQLCKNCFVRYFEKKVKGAVRKYKMPIGVVKGNGLKEKVVGSILKGLPHRKGKISPENLNNISNKVLYAVIYGKIDELKKMRPGNQPLYFLSDKEILLYAKIKGIKGKLVENREMKKIDAFIKKIEERNPDIRKNVVNASGNF